MALKPAIHGRDHCPGGADPIPCFDKPWVRRINLTGFSVAAGTQHNVTYDDAGNDTDPSITGSTGAVAWENFFDIGSSSVTTPLKQGFYIISGQYHFENQITEPILVNMHDGFDWSTGQTYVGHASFEDPSVCFTFPHRYVGANNTIVISLQHGNASTQDVIVCYTEFWYLGPYLGPNPGFDADGDENLPYEE